VSTARAPPPTIHKARVEVEVARQCKGLLGRELRRADRSTADQALGLAVSRRHAPGRSGARRFELAVRALHASTETGPQVLSVVRVDRNGV
jgi:hypothetical protein